MPFEAALAPGDVACVLAEPALTNIGIVLPEPGFHDALRRLTRDTGTLLVIDETHTICAGPGGCTAAWGLEPDLLVIGKTIGGGVPAAAYGLTAEVAERLSGALFARGRRRQRGRRHPDRQRAGARCGAGHAVARRCTDDDFAQADPAGRARGPPGSRRPSTSTGCRGPCSSSAAAPSTGSARRLATAPRPRPQSTHELDAFMHLWALNRGVLLTPFHNMALLSPYHRADDVDRHTAVFAAAVEALAA